jgi:hypothetical protein
MIKELRSVLIDNHQKDVIFTVGTCTENTRYFKIQEIRIYKDSIAVELKSVFNEIDCD